MLQVTHSHYRPDMVERTGVIEPYDIRQLSPVEVARHTIDPFINGVRSPGPAVAPMPSSAAIANAAAAVAEAFKAGKRARITMGTIAVDVAADEPAPDGIVGQIVATARGIVAGRTMLVQSPGTKAALVRDNGINTNGSNVVGDATPASPLRPGMQPPPPRGYRRLRSPYARTAHPVRSPHDVSVPQPMIPPGVFPPAPNAGVPRPYQPSAVSMVGNMVAKLTRGF